MLDAEKMAACLPDEARVQCRPMVNELLAAFHEGGAERTTAMLLEQWADLDSAFNTHLADLQKLL
jgi:hypothetical protein